MTLSAISGRVRARLPLLPSAIAVLVALLAVSLLMQSKHVAAEEKTLVIDAPSGTHYAVQCDDGWLEVTEDGNTVSAQSCSAGAYVSLSSDSMTSVDLTRLPVLGSVNIVSTAPEGLVIRGAVAVRGTVNIAATSIRIEGAIAARSIDLGAAGDVILVEDSVLTAPSGVISLTSENGRLLAQPGSLINASPTFYEGYGGQISLSAAHVGVAGLVSALNGGSITLKGVNNGLAMLAGVIDVSGTHPDATGGDVRLIGGSVGLADPSARIYASGPAGGGSVLIGGDAGGYGPGPNAVEAVFVPGAMISADALVYGNGGRVVLWADDSTAFGGAISALGGPLGGNGGFIEVSAKNTVRVEGEIDVSAPAGRDGRAVIDPLFVVVVPDGPLGFYTYIDDANALAFQSSIIATGAPDLVEFFCDLFGGDCADYGDGATLGNHRVLYGQGNSILGAIAFIFPPVTLPFRFRAALSFVQTGTLELFPGNISVQSVFGVQFLHGMLDLPPGLDPGLDFDKQGAGETVEYSTFFSISAYGPISVGGADFTLKAGEPFDNEALHGIIVGMIPGGAAIEEALSADNVAAGYDFAAPIAVALYEAVLDASTPHAIATYEFINLMCGNCIPGIISEIQYVVENPQENLDKLVEILEALQGEVPGWIDELAETMEEIEYQWSLLTGVFTLPSTRADSTNSTQMASHLEGDAAEVETLLLDTALAGFDVPAFNGFAGEITHFEATCNLGAGTWTGGVGGDCWTTVPYAGEPGTVNHHDALCNLGLGSWHGGECFTTYITYDEWHDWHCPGDFCIIGHYHTKHTHVNWDLSIAGAVTPAWDDCNSGFGFWVDGECYTLPPVAGVPGLEIDAFDLCNLGTGFWVADDCYTVPPAPPFHIPGLCEIPGSGIPCSGDELVHDIVIPWVTEAVKDTVAYATGEAWDAVMAFAKRPGTDTIPIPEFSVDNNVPALIYLDEPVINPNGTITLSNSSVNAGATVAFNDRLRANVVTIDVPGGSIENKSIPPLSGLGSLGIPLDFGSQSAGFAEIVAPEVVLSAGAGIGAAGDGRIRLSPDVAGAGIDVDITNASFNGIHLVTGASGLTGLIENEASGRTIEIEGEGALTLAATVRSENGPLTLVSGAGFGLTAAGLLDAGSDDISLNAGAGISLLGDVTGNVLNATSAGGNDNWNARAYPSTPVNANGGAGLDSLAFDNEGLTHAQTVAGQVLVTGRAAFTHTNFETITGIDPTVTEVTSETASVNEGDVYTATVSFIDWGADAWDVVVDWGDGEVTHHSVARTSADPVVTADVTHVYGDDYVGPVSVTVVDTQDGGTSAADTVALTVLNVTPVIDDSELTPEINENGIATLTGDFTDPGTGDTFLLEIVWGDGVTDVVALPAGQRDFLVSHRYLDDDPSGTASDSYEVTIALADDDEPAVADTAAHETTVSNVAPVIDTLSVTSTDEGGVATVSGTFTDPGSLDTFEVEVDWGEGDPQVVTVPAGTRDFEVTHLYEDDDPTGTDSDDYTVTVQLRDDDGGSDDGDELTTTVDNVDPVVGPLPGDAHIFSGQTFTLPEATFTDVGVRDTHTATIDWGDGSSPESGSVTHGDGSGTVTGSHRYTRLETYTIEVCVTDDDGGVDCNSGELTVTRLPVAIEVLTGGPNNRLALPARGIPIVDLLGRIDFPAETTLSSTVLFGVDPAEIAPANTAAPQRDGRSRDANRDGFDDMRLQFAAPDLGIPGGTPAGTVVDLYLTGELADGTLFIGSDTVEIVGGGSTGGGSTSSTSDEGGSGAKKKKKS